MYTSDDVVNRAVSDNLPIVLGRKKLKTRESLKTREHMMFTNE